MAPAQLISLRWLAATIALAARCFPTDVGYQWALALSADREGEIGRELARAARLEIARQWIVAHGMTVAGTYGLYQLADRDACEERMLLLNWFCVNPDFRHHGLGRQLWTDMLNQATGLGARRVIFYSSTEPFHGSAEKLYLAAGCARRLGPMLPDGVHHLTYFDLPLRSDVPPADSQLAGRIDTILENQSVLDADPALVALASTGQPAALAA